MLRKSIQYINTIFLLWIILKASLMRFLRTRRRICRIGCIYWCSLTYAFDIIDSGFSCKFQYSVLRKFVTDVDDLWCMYDSCVDSLTQHIHYKAYINPFIQILQNCLSSNCAQAGKISPLFSGTLRLPSRLERPRQIRHSALTTDLAGDRHAHSAFISVCVCVR